MIITYILFFLYSRGADLRGDGEVKGVGGVWVKKYKLGSSYRTFSHGFRTFRRMQKFQVLFELSRETSRENAPLRGPKWAKQESKFDINPVLVTLAP